MTKRPFFITAAAALLVCLASCSKEGQRQSAGQIIFSVNEFELADDDIPGTKTSIRNGTQFIWTATDTVGIYPDTGGQVYFSMTSGAGASSAIFDGGGWDFKPSSSYYSYYPFIGDMYLDRHHIPVSYLGQVQPTADDIDHIGAYDFMYSSAASAQNGSLLFSFAHLNCLVRVTATLLAGTYTKMIITSPDSDFTVKGYYDLMAVNPAIIPQETSDQLSINLGNITFDTTTTFNVYLMTAPVNLKDKDIIVSFYTLSGTRYSQVKRPSRKYDAETIGGLTCNNLVRTGDYTNGVGVDNVLMGDDDETLTINQ